MEPVYFIDPESDELLTSETLEEWLEARELPEDHREYFREFVRKYSIDNLAFWESQNDWKERSQDDKEILIKSTLSMFIQKLIFNVDNDVLFKNKPNMSHPRYIPKHIKMEVWRRDEGRCAECGSKEKLEYDHIIPFTKGGSNTARNIQLLCERCNRLKSSKIE
jgi:hypothetical protein